MTTLGPLLGTGRQAHIYAWDERKVVKLFRSQTHLGQVEREASLTGTLSTTGLPAPLLTLMVGPSEESKIVGRTKQELE
jgi:hypothetical protein